MGTEQIRHSAGSPRAGQGRRQRLAPSLSKALRQELCELGIPETEFTPRVRSAIAGLTAEVRTLRVELALARSRLEDVERVADHDQLLPVLNRRAFVRELSREIAATARYQTRASLVYFDLDGFKGINDLHGHACGDALLVHFAQILLRHVRESDAVARLGGDEFAVLLTHAGRDQAERKAASLGEMVNANPALWESKPLPLSFSYGVLELAAGDTAEDAMARADAAMYRHKRAR